MSLQQWEGKLRKSWGGDGWIIIWVIFSLGLFLIMGIVCDCAWGRVRTGSLRKKRQKRTVRKSTTAFGGLSYHLHGGGLLFGEKKRGGTGGRSVGKKRQCGLFNKILKMGRLHSRGLSEGKREGAPGKIPSASTGGEAYDSKSSAYRIVCLSNKTSSLETRGREEE